MSKVKVREILERAGLEYHEYPEKNVSPGNVNIRCPFCGHRDPSWHCGINLNTGEWGCWRNSDHTGKELAVLLAKALGCSVDEAREFTDTFTGPTGNLSTLRDRLSNNPDREVNEGGFEVVSMPEEFRDIRRVGVTRRFYYYLQQRGFHDVEKLCSTYNLKCALSGRWNNRIIFPFYREGELIGWQGRAIDAGSLRYDSHPSGDTLKRHIYLYDFLARGGSDMIICEGPFDALKLDFYGSFDSAPGSIRATCTLGSKVTDAQIRCLAECSEWFRRVYIAPDSDGRWEGERLASRLRFLSPMRLRYPEGVDDPGELTPREVLDVLRSINRRSV